MSRFQRINLFFGMVLLLFIVAAGVRAQTSAQDRDTGPVPADAATPAALAGPGAV